MSSERCITANSGQRPDPCEPTAFSSFRFDATDNGVDNGANVL